MALIICPECNNQVSSQATACPHCGYPIAGKTFAYSSQTTANHTYSGNAPQTGNVMAMKVRAIDPRLAKEFADFEQEYGQKMSTGSLNSASATSLALLMRALNEKMVFHMIRTNRISEAQIQAAFTKQMPGKEYNQGSAYAAMAALLYYGFISRSTFESMDQIRFWGNKAAHGGATITDQAIRNNYAHLTRVVDAFAGQPTGRAASFSRPQTARKSGGGAAAFLAFVAVIAIVIFCGFLYSQWENENDHSSNTTFSGSATTGNSSYSYGNSSAGSSAASSSAASSNASGSYINDDTKRFVEGEQAHYFTMSVGESVKPGPAIWNGNVDVSDSSVVSVGSDGTIYANGTGSTTVTYHGGSLQQTYTIVVE